MTLTYDHEAACSTTGCLNEGIVFDVPSLDGNMSPMICGACGTNFTANATPKA